MQKNPNFEWKPVSTGNEKFMIVLSWVVVAFVVIVAGLYYGRTSRVADPFVAGGELIPSEGNVSVGQGQLQATADTQRTLSRETLGRQELYTVMLGSGNSDFSRSEAEERVNEFIARGYAARAVESDLHNQRFHVYIGRFEEYAAAARALDEFKGQGLPVGLTVISRKVAAGFRDKGPAAPAVPTAPPADPIRRLIRDQRGETPDAPAGIPAGTATPEAPAAEGSAALHSSTTDRLAAIVENVRADAERPVKPVVLNTVARIGKEETAETIPPAGSSATMDAEDLALTDKEKDRLQGGQRSVGGDGQWKLQLATFGALSYALNYKNKLEKDGFAPVRIKESTSSRTGKTYYQVRIEGFSDKDAAQRFLQDVFQPYDPKIKPMITK